MPAWLHCPIQCPEYCCIHPSASCVRDGLTGQVQGWTLRCQQLCLGQHEAGPTASRFLLRGCRQLEGCNPGLGALQDVLPVAWVQSLHQQLWVVWQSVISCRLRSDCMSSSMNAMCAVHAIDGSAVACCQPRTVRACLAATGGCAELGVLAGCSDVASSIPAASTPLASCSCLAQGSS